MGVRGLKAERHTHQTPVPDVFAAGSAVTPSHHAIKAVAAGRLAALAMAQHLAGQPLHVEERPYTVHMGRLHECELPLLRQEGAPHDRVAPAGGDNAAFTDAEMRQETARCLHCDCLKVRDCRLRECAAAGDASPTRFKGERRQYRKEFTHPDVVFEPGKCIACGRCVAITERAGEKLGLAFTGRGFTVRVAVPFDAPLAAGLTKVARECVEACPTAALSWRPQS
jgi:ferredoxin